MKYMIRVAGLCMIAVFALGAILASQAQAETTPEWVRCVAQEKGNYTESQCKTVSEKKGVADHKGDYELLSGADPCVPQKKGEYTESECKTKSAKAKKGTYEKSAALIFTGAGGGGTVLNHIEFCEDAAENERRVPRADCVTYGSNSDFEFHCGAEDLTGEAAGTDELTDVHMRFTGCEFDEALACNSVGKVGGEIETSALKGKLGYIDKETHEAGLLFEPAAHGGHFAEFECEGFDVKFVIGVGNATEGSYYEAGPPYDTPGEPNGDDGIMAPVVPVDSITDSLTQEYTYNASEENIPNELEGGPREDLEVYEEGLGNGASSLWGQFGIDVENVDTLSEYAEIKA